METIPGKVIDIKEKAENLTGHLTAYAETFIKLGAVNTAVKSTQVATISLTALVVLMIGMLVLLFTGLSVAVWLAEYWNSMRAGYLAVGGFFLLCMVVLLLMSPRVILPYLRNLIIKKLYE